MSGGTKPIEQGGNNTAPMAMIQPTYKDETTGALYVHSDLVKVQEPWAEEEHLSPMDGTERFGDVESWVEFVQRFGGDDVSAPKPFLTWNKQGLFAVMDYATPGGLPGRCKWGATCPFIPTRQWNAWMTLCGRPLGQRQAVEALEDLAEDILEPSSTELANILRTLRATVKSRADTELRTDGTSSVVWTRDQAVKSGGEGTVDMPASFTIGIPVLKGHMDAEGKAVSYRLDVRVRIAVDDDARLAFRFSIPTAERVLEECYLDRVQAAKALLGESLPLLRAAD